MRRAVALLGAVTATSAARFIEATPGLTGEVEYVPGEFLVTMKKTALAEAHHAVATRFQGRKLAIGASFKAVHLSASEEQLKELLAHPDVEAVERNQIARAAWSVNATKKKALTCKTVQEGASWGQTRVTRESAETTGSEPGFRHDPVWGTGSTVYVLDTGVRVTHSEFEGRARWGAKFTPPGDSDTDRNGHGTHCAGTIGGKTYGIAKACEIVAVKVLSDQGSGSFAGIIDGIEWAAKDAQKKGIANLSLGGGYSLALNRAVDAAVKEEGLIMVNAAGNDNRDSCNYSPASADEGVCVGATQQVNRRGVQRDQRSSFSNYGKCNDIFAPGSGIIAAWTGTDNAFNTISGTSMAAPHVAGVLAVLREMNPSASADDLKKLMLEEAEEGVVSDSKDSPNKFLNLKCEY